jgi:hypothetical protein
MYNQIQGLVYTGNGVPWAQVQPWTTLLAAISCPSDSNLGEPTSAGRTRGMNSYAYCGGDNVLRSNVGGSATAAPAPLPTRGLFSALRCFGIRDCTDGTSNTIAMSEKVRPIAPNSWGMVVNNSATTPAACAIALLSDKTYAAGTTYTGDTAPGFRWADGAAYFAGFGTTVPPNGASCFTTATQGHWERGLYTASSRHVGGTHALLADGAVRFISENIDSGNQAAAPPAEGAAGPSPYGVWGALGTKQGGEVISEF